MGADEHGVVDVCEHAHDVLAVCAVGEPSVAREDVVLICCLVLTNGRKGIASNGDERQERVTRVWGWWGGEHTKSLIL